MNELPLLRANASFFVFQILTEDMRAWVLRATSLQIRPQTLSMPDREGFSAEQVQYGVRNIHGFREVGYHSGPDAVSPPHGERNAERRLKAAMLFEPSMLPKAVAMVRHIND